ncbi:AmmeMemoRadiSam system protein B [Bacteroidota bacterium]
MPKIAYLFLVAGIFTTNCNSQDNTRKPMEEQQQTIDRKPCAAGRFYASDPKELQSNVKELFAKALPKKNDDIVRAIIVPHAGYPFSGEVAATGFNQIDLNKEYKDIFIIGSSHKTSFSGASIYCMGNYITPLGTVQVDIELANKLIKEDTIFKCYPDAHQFEHSLEVELPLLQYIMKKEYRIVPIVMGLQSKENSKKVADALMPYFTEDNLFIISSDFSHYPEYKHANNVDKATAEAIKTNDPDQLMKTLLDNDTKGIYNLRTSLCGWTSVLTLLYITEQIEDIDVELLQYMNSGDSPYGDKESVVGYYSIMFSKKKITNKQEVEFKLDENEKEYLLLLARNTVNEYISNDKIPKINKNEVPDNLKTNCGAFVTLHKEGKLRGCIGRFGEERPLYQVVQDMAIAASTQDSRFPRVTAEELPQLDIEISVLTPLRKIESIDEFELGKHGIYIKKGYASGTFLPQVAHGRKWTKEDFLGYCSREKAGIGWDGWKNADLYTYEAIIFSEKELKK